MNSVNYDLLGVPPRYRRCRIENFAPKTDAQRKAVELMKDVMNCTWGGYDGDDEEEGCIDCNILLIGPPGVGKTHLAAGYLFSSSEGMEADSFYLNWPGLAQRMRAGENVTADVRRACESLCLVLDDLTEPETAAETRALWDIVDHRYSKDYWGMVITTNIPGAQLRKRLGDRIADRLFDRTLVLSLDGESQRRPVEIPAARTSVRHPGA